MLIGKQLDRVAQKVNQYHDSGLLFEQPNIGITHKKQISEKVILLSTTLHLGNVMLCTA